MLFSALMACATVAMSESALANGDFEGPVSGGGWELPAGWTVEPGVGRQGSRALVWENSDPKAYRFASVGVSLEPGVAYRIGAWVKVDSLSGGRVDMEMYWFDETGNRLGICNARRTVNNDVGTDGWVWHEGMTTPMPGSVRREGTFVCCVRRGAVGRVRFDEFSVVPQRVEWIEYLTSSAYRDTVSGDRGVVRVVGHIHVNTSRHRLADIRAELSFVASDGARKTLAPLALTPESVEFGIKTGELGMGEQDLSLRLFHEGKPVAEKTLRLTRTETPVRRHVALDEKGRVRLDGRPFFPLGMYLWRLTDAQLETYAQGPFNFALQYGDVRRRDLDRFAEKGIHVAADVRHYVYGYDHAARCAYKTPEESRKAIRALVDEIGGHPALMAWYLVDEAPRKLFPNVADANRYFHEIDGHHPTYAVTDTPGNVRSMVPCFDVLGMDPYPVGNVFGGAEEFKMCSGWAHGARTATFGTRPMWHVPQAFNWAWYRKSEDPDVRMRMPSRAEMANMNWQAVAAWANGLCLYGYHSMYRNLKGAEFDSAWRDVCAAASEIKRMEDVLLSDELPLEARLTDEVAVRGWTLCGKAYCLVVNRNARAARGRVRMARRMDGLDVKVGSGASLSQDGRGIEYDFPPLGYAFVELSERPWWKLFQ